MTNPAAYTSLESLFLFQSLLTNGVDNGAFSRTSNILKNNALIKGSDSYDPARLSPDALQELFLLLLQEEISGDNERKKTPDGSSSPLSKKRKLASLPLPTLADAYIHLDKVPALIDLLYSRYRDHVVSQIREDERKFETVQREIQLLERSEKERLAKTASQSGTPILAPRDIKSAAKSNSSSPSPGPTAGVLAGIKRTPGALAPKGSSIKPTAPKQEPSGTNSALAHPSTRPNHGSTSTLQPGSPANTALKSVLTPRADAAASLQSQNVQVAKSERPLPTPQPGQPLVAVQPTPLTSGNPRDQRPSQQPSPSEQQAPATTRAIPAPSTTMQPLQPKLLPGKHVTNSQPPKIIDQAVSALPSQPQPGATTGNPPVRPVASQQLVRPIAAASASSGSPTPSTIPPQSSSQKPLVTTGLGGQKEKPYTSPYGAHHPRPAIPEHMIRQAASTPLHSKRLNTTVSVPQTPAPVTPVALTRGFGTKWASQSTPSTPGPIADEPESPAYEPVSPPQHAASLARAIAKSASAKENAKQKIEPPIKSLRSRPSRGNFRGHTQSATPSATATRRSQSIASQPDELSLDYNVMPTKIKKEYLTPRPHDETGDTTADESVHSKARTTTPNSVSRPYKRKRPELPVEATRAPTHVLWTRGFTKVSSSALDQISSHRDANMFANALRERDAPGYRQVVLQPQNITSIRAAIKHGNKTAMQAAASLADGDPGTPSVWLPISEDLIPPKAIVNSAQLERELVHMFCNAIMYNPDPDRGFGQAFMKRSPEEEEEILGYHLDENGVVRNTRGMFVEVEKLLSDLRNAEKDRAPPPPATSQPIAATPVAEETAEEEDELAGQGDVTPHVAKRRRTTARG